ncbi:HAD hydrolase, family IE, partial [Ancylostoma ceylanicum]
MPTPVVFPVAMIDENSRTIAEQNFDSIFNRPHVMMRDRDTVERKLRVMVEGGKQKLMIISDFDYTLSRFEDAGGTRCWTTHGVFDNCAKQVDPELANKFERLKEKYFPIEFDPKLSQEQKIPYMEEWQTGENYGKSCHPPDVVVKTCQKADNMDKTIDEESVYSMAPQA